MTQDSFCGEELISLCRRELLEIILRLEDSIRSDGIQKRIDVLA